MKPRDVLATVMIAGATTLATAIPALNYIDHLGLDSLHWLRHTVFGVPHKPEDSPSVVVAIDEETYQTPPYKGLPKIMWAKQLASILDGVMNGGAKVIGFDVIYPTSVEPLLPNFEKDLRRTLFKGGRSGRIVLGKVQHSAKPLAPHAGQVFAVGGQRNLRAVNAFEDEDGIIRRMPLTLKALNRDGSVRTESSMSLELTARALKQKWAMEDDGRLRLGDWIVPGSESGNVVLNFDGGWGDIPYYSFADLAACAEKGRTGYFEKNFKDKVVLVGTVLDVGDRKLTSKRFITGEEGVVPVERCELQPPNDLYKAGIVRDAIPGVFVHATAVNNLIRRDMTVQASAFTNFWITLIFAFLAAGATFFLKPVQSGLAVIGGMVVWAGIATSLFKGGFAPSLFDPMIAAPLTFALMLEYQFTVTDKDKRYIRKVFSFYLPPTVIEKMTSDDQLPTLGGESKEVTIFFSDIAKFSTLSEALTAGEVATFLNEYLTEMSDLIEERGGFIEKFVADEITGVFGAPVDDPDHAFNAVDAALACRARLAEMKGAFGLPADSVLTARIGINTGEMLVGNIGSYRRFNYAAMGDAANLGSRLEGANKYYDSLMMVGERTHELCGDRAVFREIDTILVMGRETPVRCFEPLGHGGQVPVEMLEIKEKYETALAVYRDRRFGEAAALFETIAENDPVARIMSDRSRAYVNTPPPEDWRQAYILGGK